MLQSILKFAAIAVMVCLFTVGPIAAENLSGPININTADATTLVALKQVGKVRAQAILKYREEHGAFKAIDDIKLVPGIGGKIFDVIKDKITVDGEPK